MKQIFTIFAEKGEKPPMQMLIISRYNEKKNYLVYGEREHRTPWTDVGRADIGIQFRRNGRRKERHGMPHKECCGKADSIGGKRRKKLLPAWNMSRQEF